MTNCYNCKNQDDCEILERMKELQNEFQNKIFEHDFLYNGLAKGCSDFEEQDE